MIQYKSAFVCFRLFYLYHDTMETYVNEENFFNCLTGVCHTLCGLCISVLVGDNFFINEYDSSIIDRSCAKIPKIILVEQSHHVYNLYTTMHVAAAFVGLCINIAIFLKQRQLESKQSVADFVATYNTSDVQIIRQTKQPNRILWRFRRNVISPLGSFSSFLACVVYNLLGAYIFFSRTPSGPSILAELLLFSVHGVYFFCVNFIESIFSPTLCNSLINVIPWLRHEYHTVVV